MKTIFILSLAFSSAIYCAQDDPRIEAHNKLTDYLLNLGNEQAEAKERERMALLAQDRIADETVDDDEDS